MEIHHNQFILSQFIMTQILYPPIPNFKNTLKLHNETFDLNFIN